MTGRVWLSEPIPRGVLMATTTEHVRSRSYPAPPERIWELRTTPEGIASWWAPDGFSIVVDLLEVRPGGSLDYTMTATGEEQIAFVERDHPDHGHPATDRYRHRRRHDDRTDA